MKFDYPQRFTVALGFVVTLGVISDVYFAISHKVFTVAEPTYEDVGLYEKKFADLRRLLPSRGPVGYLGDSKNDLGDPKARRRYYFTQYTLAPVIVANTSSLPLVIGNFHDDVPSLDVEGLTLLKDFGDGVRLFRNNSPNLPTPDQSDRR